MSLQFETESAIAMKKKFISFLIILTMLASFTSAKAADLKLIAPTDTEFEIAPTRDFYVIGEIMRDLDASDMPLDVKIELVNDRGIAVRELKSHVSSGGLTSGEYILFDYELGHSENDTKNVNLMKFAPPDIVYNGSSRDSVRNTYLKIVVSEKYFAAIIYGGATQSFDILYADEHEQALSDITEGQYSLVVTLLNGMDEEVARAEKKITIGTGSDRLIASSEGIDLIKEYANENGDTIPSSLAGYWHPSFFTSAPEDFAYIISSMYVQNAAVEYGEAENVKLFLYALDTEERSVNVPLGGALNSDSNTSFSYLYYDIGEPEVKFDLAGKTVIKKGSLKEEKSSFAKVLRTETYDEYGAFYPDFDVKNGVIMRVGAETVFYGAYSPIGFRAASGGDGFYRISDRAVKVKAFIKNKLGGTVYETECEPTMTRVGADKEEYDARYEFKFSVLPSALMASDTYELSFGIYDAEDQLLLEGESIMCSVKDDGISIALYDDLYWGKAFCDAVNFFGQTPSGYPLDPDEHITRGDFAAMVNRFFGYAKQGSAAFNDIDESSEYYKDVLTAQGVGYMTGDENMMIKEKDALTREEAAIILSRIIGVDEMGDEDISFLDEDEISFWAEEYVSLMASTGIISGFEGYFHPHDNITAAEAAALIAKSIYWMYPSDESSQPIISGEQKTDDTTSDNFEDIGLSEIAFPDLTTLENITEEDVREAFSNHLNAFEKIRDYIVSVCGEGVYIRRVGNGLDIRDYRVGNFIPLSDDAIRVLTDMTKIYPELSVRYNPSSGDSVYFVFAKNEAGKEFGLLHSASGNVPGRDIEKLGDNWYYFIQK